MTVAADLVSPAVAATGLARALGVPVEHTTVLRAGSNVSVLLEPAMLVAKVALRRRAVRRSGDWFARELAIAEFLRPTPVDAVRPATTVPPGPHRYRGHLLAFWECVDVTAAPVAPGIAGRSLRECHRVLSGYRPDTTRPPYDPCAECDEVLAGTPPGHFLAGERALLTTLAGPLFDVVRRWTGPSQPLHGDPTPENVLRSGGSCVWCDFEDTYVGSTWWDVACLVTPAVMAGDDDFVQRATEGYGVPADDPALAAFVGARAMHSAIWSAYIDNPGPSRTRLRRLAWLRGKANR
jgi:hypothetical protein